MIDILNIEDEPIFDDCIVKIEIHTYIPFANTTFGHSDEIRILIQQQDLYTLPHENFLYIEGKLINQLRGLMWHWEIIALRSYSMTFDINSTVWRLIAIETLV